MKEFLFGAAGIVLAGAAIAQTQPAPTPQPVTEVAPVPHAAPAMREHSRDEMVARVREHFAKLDANKDGFLTRDEADAGREVIKQRIVEKMGEKREDRMAKRDPNAAFDRLDANKDGSISRDEFAKAREMRIERRVERKDGAAAPGRRMMRMHRMGGMIGGHMFDMADVNKDGRVTLQEATDAAARHFDMADANRDGRITPDERRKMHKQMIEKHRAPKAG